MVEAIRLNSKFKGLKNFLLKREKQSSVKGAASLKVREKLQRTVILYFILC